MQKIWGSACILKHMLQKYKATRGSKILKHGPPYIFTAMKSLEEIFCTHLYQWKGKLNQKLALENVAICKSFGAAYAYYNTQVQSCQNFPPKYLHNHEEFGGDILHRSVWV